MNIAGVIVVHSRLSFVMDVKGLLYMTTSKPYKIDFNCLLFMTALPTIFFRHVFLKTH